MVGTGCREHAEASSAQGMAPAESAGMHCQPDLMERIVDKDNMREAYARVRSNRGSAGADRMGVPEMHDYFKEHADELLGQVLTGRYAPSPVLRVKIPKQEKGKVRKLGIPTVVDRVVQQAIAQQLTPLFEPQFHDSSYGFRPREGAHDALMACKRNVDEGYIWVVDMDLEKFFDTVCQPKLIQILSETVKDGRVVSLVHKYLDAGVMVGGVRATLAEERPSEAAHCPPAAGPSAGRTGSSKGVGGLSTRASCSSARRAGSVEHSPVPCSTSARRRGRYLRKGWRQGQG